MHKSRRVRTNAGKRMWVWMLDQSMMCMQECTHTNTIIRTSTQTSVYWNCCAHVQEGEQGLLLGSAMAPLQVRAPCQLIHTALVHDHAAYQLVCEVDKLNSSTYHRQCLPSRKELPASQQKISHPGQALSGTLMLPKKLPQKSCLHHSP